MSNVQLMRGEGNLSLLRGVNTITRDINKAKSWVTLHNNEVVDKYPEYGTYYMDGEHKRRVQTKTHKKWGMEYYSNTLKSYLRSEDWETSARIAVERVLQNTDLIALMKGAQYVPKLVVTRVQNPRASSHVGVYTLKSLPALTKFEVKRSDFRPYMKSWKFTRFIDSQLALDYLAFLDKYEVLIATVSLKLKASRAKATHEFDKRDLVIAEKDLERRQTSYTEWLANYGDFKAKWEAQEAWLKAMPDHLPNHDVGRQMRYTHGAVLRDPVREVDSWDKEIEHLTKSVANCQRRVNDYEDVYGGEEE